LLPLPLLLLLLLLPGFTWIPCGRFLPQGMFADAALVTYPQTGTICER